LLEQNGAAFPNKPLSFAMSFLPLHAAPILQCLVVLTDTEGLMAFLMIYCVDFGMIAEISRYPNTPQSRFTEENIKLQLGTRLANDFGSVRWS
jgi:hypothetical protein